LNIPDRIGVDAVVGMTIYFELPVVCVKARQLAFSRAA